MIKNIEMLINEINLSKSSMEIWKIDSPPYIREKKRYLSLIRRLKHWRTSA